MTRLLLSQLHSNHLIEEVNLIKIKKVIWDYASEDEEEKGPYQIYGNQMELFISLFKKCHILSLDEKYMIAQWGN